MQEVQSPKSKVPNVGEVIAEVTGLSGKPVATVWVYGKAGWCHAGRMEFVVEPPGPKFKYPRLRPRAVELVTSVITRYRDGESACFLVEMPRSMAEVFGIKDYVLDADQVERKMADCHKF